MLPPISTLNDLQVRRGARPRSRRTMRRCAGSAATRTRALRESRTSGLKCFSPISISARTGSSGNCAGNVLSNSPMRVVDDGAAVGGARRRVDLVERRQLEHVLGVDRVGIAQQVLDLGDAEASRSRGERRRRRRPRRRLRRRRPRRAGAPAPCSARRARARRPSALRRRPRRAAARSARPPSARRRAWRRGSGSPRARRAPARNRAPKDRCAAPADRGRGRGASAG